MQSHNIIGEDRKGDVIPLLPAFFRDDFCPVYGRY